MSVSDRVFAFSDGQTPPMDVMKLMVVALAGWINQQQEDVIEHHLDRNRQGLEPRLDEPGFGSAKEATVGCRERLGGLLRYCLPDAGTRHEIDDPGFWTLRVHPERAPWFHLPLPSWTEPCLH